MFDIAPRPSVSRAARAVALVAVAALAAAACQQDGPTAPDLSGDSDASQIAGDEQLPLRPAAASDDPAVVQVEEPLSCSEPQHVDFEELLPGGFFSFVSLDGIVPAGPVRVAERFAGHSVVAAGAYDDLAEAATAPLTLEPGASLENILVTDPTVPELGSSATIAGLGTGGFFNPDAPGRGAVAIRFDGGKSDVGLTTWMRTGSSGSLIVTFYRANGSVIDVETVSPPGGEKAWVFKRSSGSDIAGITLENNGGPPLNYDDLLLCGSDVITVDLEVKPPSEDPAPINTTSRGRIPVAILGTAGFDVRDVDVATLAFGPDGAPAVGEGALEDVNDDGLMDLVTHHRQQETGLSPDEDTEACMAGATLSGTPLKGCDAVTVREARGRGGPGGRGPGR